MQLKTYQQKSLEQLERWVDALKNARSQLEKRLDALNKAEIDTSNEPRNYPEYAWNALKRANSLPTITQKDGSNEIPNYITRTTASGEPIPHVCMKVPTGGGKTLLGVVSLEKLLSDKLNLYLHPQVSGVASLEKLLSDKGFVLWIVPTRAIYEQTIKAFRNREHPYRETLERISGGRVKLLEKDDLFTKQDVESYLCVMILMLPSANRQTGKEFLKIFRDSGRYASFFPEHDDPKANQTLIEEHKDLEKNKTSELVKQSLINVLKLIRPTVILDEAHKAYGKTTETVEEFVKSVNRINPRFVLELSATPKAGISNILVSIGGTELKDEEMIKLPIEVHSFKNSDWKHTLTETNEKLNQLEKEATALKHKEDRYIRPIALVRVERTGADQKGQGRIHAEDAKEYLIKNLAVPEAHIRVQSSDKKELAGEDLLSEMSQVRWILTKDALKEGWDCSFAYILALLDNTKAKTAMTQMVGRVMRQPQARTVDKSTSLNRCYIYCYNEEVGEAVQWVKDGLEQEGLTGLDVYAMPSEGGKGAATQLLQRRKPYRKLDIFLPRVLHKDGNKWRPIDYDRDILGSLNWEKVDANADLTLGDGEKIAEMTVAVDVAGDSNDFSEAEIEVGKEITLHYFVRRLTDVVPNPWQAARIADSLVKKLNQGGHDSAKLLKNRVHVSEVIRRRVREEVDDKAETLFRHKVREDEIRFKLVTDKQLNYEVHKSLEVTVANNEVLLSKMGRPVQSSLFEDVFASELNGLEKNTALYLEESDSIHWWHRIAARQEYSIQGWRRHRVYPDFIARVQRDGKGTGRLLILETKGNHLQGNEDTNYKKNLLEFLEGIYENALERGEMSIREDSYPNSKDIILKMTFENTWEEDLGHVIAGKG